MRLKWRTRKRRRRNDTESAEDMRISVNILVYWTFPAVETNDEIVHDDKENIRRESKKWVLIANGLLSGADMLTLALVNGLPTGP